MIWLFAGLWIAVIALTVCGCSTACGLAASNRALRRANCELIGDLHEAKNSMMRGWPQIQVMDSDGNMCNRARIGGKDYLFSQDEMDSASRRQANNQTTHHG
jgi:hypothetical protein